MKTKQCQICNNTLDSRSHSCPYCTRINFGKLPISNFRDRGNGRLNKVRDHAQRVYAASDRPRICMICGYNLFIDICHIKDLQYFPDDTPISVVNDMANLLGLCPNCHREFDNGLVPDSILLDLNVPKDIIDGKKKEDNCCPKCGGKKFRTAITCLDCVQKPTKVEWPTKEELKELVWKMPTTKIASNLGVTDKAIEKRCKRLGIAKPPAGYWTKIKYS
jgi:hypothetical protein